MAQSTLRIFEGKWAYDDLPDDMFGLDVDADDWHSANATIRKIIVIGKPYHNVSQQQRKIVAKNMEATGAKVKEKALLFVAEFVLVEVECRGEQYISYCAVSSFKERSSVDILSEAETEVPPGCHPDYWGYEEEDSQRIPLIECTQSTNIINCPFVNLESLFTAHVGYGQDSVAKGAFPLPVFQLVQQIWTKYAVPCIQNRPELLMKSLRLCDLEAMCKEHEEFYWKRMTDERNRRTNITFAYLCSQLPDIIILEYILPHFNYFGNYYKKVLFNNKKQIREEQEKVRHLNWTM